MPEALYTYQGGRKLPLLRDTTHFISRAAKADLLSDSFVPIAHVSPRSWRVETNPATIDEDMRRARRLAPAYAAYTIAGTGSRFLVTDRIFVRFHDAFDDTVVSTFAQQHELKLLDQLSPRDCLFSVSAATDVVDMVRRLTEEQRDVVELVDHDLNIQPVENGILARGRDPLAPLQWYLHSSPVDDEQISACALLDCEGAWRTNGYGSPDVVIAVVDCGCDLTDPNFGGDQKFASWAILIDGHVYSESDWERARQMMEPMRLHGTLCATLAAASANDVGGLGVAPDCRLLPVKWQELTGAETLSQSLFGKLIGFLSDKADVVSSSWSLGANGYWPPVVVDVLRDAAQSGGRSGKGILWIWSAGNHNSPIDHHGTVRVPTKVSSSGVALVVEESSAVFANSFAGVPGVLHVGAISSLGQRCHYSNYGRGLDLVAPSNNEHLYGRVQVSGAGMMAPLKGDGLHPFGGTSAAAPLVAGVAALVRSANPNLTACEVASILKQTADKDLDMSGYPRCHRDGDLPDAQWDVSPIAPFDSGTFGGDDPDGSWSPWFGFGKVNARRAVEEALRRATA